MDGFIQQPSLFDAVWVFPAIIEDMDNMPEDEIKITPGRPPTGTVTWAHSCKEFSDALKAFYRKFGKGAVIDKVYKTVSAAHGETTYFFVRKEE